jgi:hypothetical protein
MQLNVCLDSLNDMQVVRFAGLLSGLRDPGRSRAFNDFALWGACECKREIRRRLLGLYIGHVLSVRTNEMRPGETVFLTRRAKEWRDEFGEPVVGQLIEALEAIGGSARAYALKSLAL